MDQLLLPFYLPFMVKGMVITISIALPMALLSCFLILKGWSLLGDAMSHAIFPGVVLGYMTVPQVMAFAVWLGWAPLLAVPQIDMTMAMMALGAFVASMVCAILISFIGDHSRVKRDTVMGIIFSAMFGLGLVLSSMVRSELHLMHILFGNLLGVSWTDIGQTMVIAGVIFLFLGVKWRDFMLFSFDEIQAKAAGLRVQLLHYILLMMIALAIVAALKAVGIVLSISLLIAPGAIAYLLTKRFSSMLWVAFSVAGFASVFGVYISLFLGSDSAATVVLTLASIFIAAFFWTSYAEVRLMRDSSGAIKGKQEY